jgi:hypothetical protein
MPIWINGTSGEARATEIALNADGYGNFICININKMTVKQIQQTCIHESLHEFYAQKCTSENEDKCIKALENLE